MLEETFVGLSNSVVAASRPAYEESHAGFSGTTPLEGYR